MVRRSLRWLRSVEMTDDVGLRAQGASSLEWQGEHAYANDGVGMAPIWLLWRFLRYLRESVSFLLDGDAI